VRALRLPDQGQAGGWRARLSPPAGAALGCRAPTTSARRAWPWPTTRVSAAAFPQARSSGPSLRPASPPTLNTAAGRSCCLSGTGGALQPVPLGAAGDDAESPGPYRQKGNRDEARKAYDQAIQPRRAHRLHPLRRRQRGQAWASSSGTGNSGSRRGVRGFSLFSSANDVCHV
jgi:hypothetical protein